MSKLGDGKDYGIMPQPTKAQDALDWLGDKCLGPGWYYVNPVCQDQVNTVLAIAVAHRSCSRTACPFRKHEEGFDDE